MELEIADIAVSLAGRDKDQLFYVIGLEDNYAILADGKGRRLERPKRKKRKHIAKVARIESRVADKLLNGDKVLNIELRKDLAAFAARGENSQNQVG